MMVVTVEQVQAMGYRDLRDECRKEGLSTLGKTERLRKRLASHVAASSATTAAAAASSAATDSTTNNKRQKRCPSDDLICPITLELPYDPVMAEDGRVYERYAIEKYFHGKRNSRRVKSPITNELIGRKLIAAPQIKNHIDTLVEEGIITGDLADKWRLYSIQNELLKKANDGDVQAMEQVANNFLFGMEGVRKDRKRACEWFAKAHEAGSIMGTAWTGERLAKSDDSSKSVKGVMLLTSAAERGSNWAAYKLGCALLAGGFGLPVDKKEAKKWLERCLDGSNCAVDHLNDHGMDLARQKLAALVAEENNNNTNNNNNRS